MKKSALYILMILSLVSCKDQEEPSNSIENSANKKSGITQKEPIIDGHTSKASLSWGGVYSGVLPCADCEGIDSYLTLNKDQSYQLKLRYLGNLEKERKEFISEGKFSWDKNDNNITLEGTEDGFRKFKVGENFLMPLDLSGKEIQGVKGNNYKLYK